MTNHYVDKVRLHDDMIEYCRAYKKYEAEKKQGLPTQKPTPCKYIGESILKISQGMASKGNFASYPFREDMVADAIINCLTYMHNYDPEKFNNPFGYFSKIVYFAFLRRIKDEKRELNEKNMFGEMQNLMSLGYAGVDGSSVNTDMNHIQIKDLRSDWDDAYREKKLEIEAEKAHNKKEGGNSRGRKKS